MKDNYCAVICEYNPLHTGHIHLLQQAAKISGCEKTLCIMSGNFTQRGNFAVADKYTRAEWALRAGADAVVELPAVFASAPARDFAYGAVRALSAIPNVTHLCFGSESGDISEVSALLKSLDDTDISALLKDGSSYSGAFSSLNPQFTSNNILAAEYLRALDTLQSHIIPITIKRSGAEFNSIQTDTDNFASATAVRKALQDCNLQQIQQHLPPYVYEDLQMIYGCNAQNGKDILKRADDRYFAMLTRCAMQGSKYLDSIAYNGGGLSARVLSHINQCGSTSELLGKVKSRHLPKSKVMRYFTACVLGIKDSDIKKAKSQRPYLRVLAISRTALSMLSQMDKKAHVVARYSHYKTTKTQALKFDILSTDIYAKLFWEILASKNPKKPLNDLSYGLNIIDTN